MGIWMRIQIILFLGLILALAAAVADRARIKAERDASVSALEGLQAAQRRGAKAQVQLAKKNALAAPQEAQAARSLQREVASAPEWAEAPVPQGVLDALAE